MKYKAIVLDFDGTIVESTDIKDKAFRELFKGYPQHLDKIMEYHLSNNATIRYDKFKYITEKILGVEYTEQIRNKLSGEFSRQVFERIANASYVPGAIEFLDYFYGKTPMFIVSMSPAAELEEIIKKRCLEKYFKRIYAYPWLKKDAIEDIIKNEKVCEGEVVFIGDTLQDYKAALLSGVHFIGRKSDRPLDGKGVVACKDFAGIKSRIY
jgi:phosphoglycolate phosphatase-like HAD superfamily hydrolase